MALKHRNDSHTILRNTLFVVAGMPASGKSTFARRLAKETKACLIDIDTATEPIVRAAMLSLTGNQNDRDSSLFKETFRVPIYQTLFEVADENLPHTHAIITGPFTKELSKPQWATEIQNSLKTPCRVQCVYLHCDHVLRKQRLVERANPRDAPKLENWEQHMEYYDKDTLPAYSHIFVDTGHPDHWDQAIQDGLLPS